MRRLRFVSVGDRNKRVTNNRGKNRRAPARRMQPEEGDRAQLDADFQKARAIFADEIFPGIDLFRAFMAAENRRVEVAPFLDHIEGPQIIVHISRKDGRIIATLIAAVTSDGVEPYWDVQSTGRVKTHWMEKIPGGLKGLTRDHVLETLKDLYATDFS
jgi:hypothetical protein